MKVMVTFLVPEGEANYDEFTADAVDRARSGPRWAASSRSEPWFFVKERAELDKNGYLTYTDGHTMPLADAVKIPHFFAIERIALGGFPS